MHHIDVASYYAPPPSTVKFLDSHILDSITLMITIPAIHKSHTHEVHVEHIFIYFIRVNLWMAKADELTWDVHAPNFIHSFTRPYSMCVRNENIHGKATINYAVNIQRARKIDCLSFSKGEIWHVTTEYDGWGCERHQHCPKWQTMFQKPIHSVKNHNMPDVISRLTISRFVAILVDWVRIRNLPIGNLQVDVQKRKSHWSVCVPLLCIAFVRSLPFLKLMVNSVICRCAFQPNISADFMWSIRKRVNRPFCKFNCF